MTHIKTLKLALEALEDVDGIDTETECVTIDVSDVITALRQAIADAEQAHWVGVSDERLMEMPEFTKHIVDSTADWSEWVCPDPESYLMKCCDCGLVHEAQFGVVRYKSETESEDCDKVDDPNVQAVFRMRRHEAWEPEDTAHRSGGLPMEQASLIASFEKIYEFVPTPETKIYELVPTPDPIKWHHPECEGQCIACLIEQVVQEAYGIQGLSYLQRHLTTPPQRKPLTGKKTTFVQRFTDAVAILCGSEPPAEFVSEWLSAAEVNGEHRLQGWVVSQSATPQWAQGIVVIDAAHVLASTPEEGEQHIEAEQAQPVATYTCGVCGVSMRMETPPQRKPLTDEVTQISEALRRHGLTLVETANDYAVISLGQITAHGIKGEACASKQ